MVALSSDTLYRVVQIVSVLFLEAAGQAAMPAGRLGTDLML
jgi:hypothetical protein